jgi:hypothetical protein
MGVHRVSAGFWSISSSSATWISGLLLGDEEIDTVSGGAAMISGALSVSEDLLSELVECSRPFVISGDCGGVDGWCVVWFIWELRVLMVTLLGSPFGDVGILIDWSGGELMVWLSGFFAAGNLEGMITGTGQPESVRASSEESSSVLLELSLGRFRSCRDPDSSKESLLVREGSGIGRERWLGGSGADMFHANILSWQHPVLVDD